MPDSSIFTYDQQVPLPLAVLSERVQNGATVQDVTYTSTTSVVEKGRETHDTCTLVLRTTEQ